MAKPRTPKGRTREVARRLSIEYPDAVCELDHRNPWELLVATILSAQTTDVRVNLVTPELFRRYPTPADLAAADPQDVAEIIRSTGFYQNKTRSILGMATAVEERFGGEVPSRLDELVTLPGVGRKTANVVLNVAFGQPTIGVDTHIFRVSNRTGIAPGKDVEEVEQRLLRLVPEEFRQHAHHWLILHGRYVCKARTPECWRCTIAPWCEYRPKTPAPQ
jgi:endonuclease-3